MADRIHYRVVRAVKRFSKPTTQTASIYLFDLRQLADTLMGETAILEKYPADFEHQFVGSFSTETDQT